MMLHFKGFSANKTKRIMFENVFAVLDSASLEQLKELSAKRRLIEESINETSCITEATAREMYGGLNSRLQQDLYKLELYLPLLENLILQVDAVIASPNINRWISELKISWTSTLSSSPIFRIKGPRFFQIDSLKYELGMTLFLYGVTLRERAFEVLSEDLQQSASLLKKAAGVYSYLNAEILPSLQPILPPDKPPEALPIVSLVTSLVCLAEAQAIAIKKAEKMEMSAVVLSKLHYGIAEFLSEATSLLQSGSRGFKDISADFVDFIYASRILHELRSSRHLAESYKLSEQVGIAIGLLRCALSKVQKNTFREQSWQAVLKKEVNEVSAMVKKYEEENAFCWREKIPLDFELPPLEGTKMVIPTPYEPQKWERKLVFKT